MDSIPAAAVSKLSKLTPFAQKMQLMLLCQYVQNLLDVERDMGLSHHLLKALISDFIPEIDRHPINGKDIFIFNTHLQLLILSTHLGDVELGCRQIDRLRGLLEQLSGRWESFDYIFEFMVRDAVNCSNIYDYAGAVGKMDVLISILDNTIGLFPIADGLSFVKDQIKSDIKGKALGTRMQARMFLIRSDRTQIGEARQDSEEAMKQFTSRADLARQCQYRSQIECEAGYYREALGWLAQSYDLDSSKASPSSVIAAIAGEEGIGMLFGAMHYARLLAAAASTENGLAADMYKHWVSGGMENRIFADDRTDHPIQVIAWKLASYHAQAGNQKAAAGHYKKALDICFRYPANWTLHSIGLGVAAERAAYYALWGHVKEAKDCWRYLNERLQLFLSRELPDAMRFRFSPWVQAMDQVKDRPAGEQFNTLYGLSRQVTY